MKENFAHKKNTSIRYKLYLAMVVINFLMLLVGALSWNAFRNSAKVIRLVTEDVVPIMNSVSDVSILGSRVSVLAPRLVFVESEDELAETYAELFALLNEMHETITDISASHEYYNNEKFVQIIEAVKTVRTQMEARLISFKNDVSYKISLIEQQKNNADLLAQTYASFMLGTPPLLDDTQFDLMIGLESVGHDDAALQVKAELMALVFKIQAEGNQLVGLLETALNLQALSGLPPQQDRFEAVRTQLDDNIAQLENEGNLPESLQSNFVMMKDAVDKLQEIGEGSNGIFLTQQALLNKNLILKNDLDNIEAIGRSMGDAVNSLSLHMGAEMEGRKNETDQKLNTGMFTIVFISIISIFFTILISWQYISKRLVGRLERLRSVMLSLASRDFSQTIEGRFDGDEIGQMASALFTFREKLIENELLTRDLRYAIEESDRARKEADKANYSKSEFLANMSHELRTPLNSIIGLSRMLVEDMDKGEDHEMASTVHKSASSLLDIVNDILDLSKIEAQQMVLERIGFDFRDTMASIVETLAPIASAKGVWLHYKYEKENMPFIVGDPVRLARILTNLIGNAIKYTLDGSVQARVDYEYVGKDKIEITCRIADTGIGIAEDKQDIIFQKFSQADGSTTRKFGGTGLGLAITKELVEMMEGKIGVNSKLGEGSTFYFTIPFETTTEVQEKERDITFQNGKDASNVNRMSIENAKILVAEDHQLNQVFIKKLLDRVGFQDYQVVENGLQVLDAYKNSHFDMILMDCHMPELNGYQATEKIRALETDKRIPIVALTADAMVGTSEKCLSVGMDDYISKPIDAKAFVAVLGKWFVFDDKALRQASTPPVPPTIVDFSSLDDYADTDDERRQFCTIFIEKTNQSLEDLKANCTDGHNEAWVEIAHQVKGGAGMIGAIQLSKLCAKAQSMRDATMVDRQIILKQIEQAYDAVKDIFDKEIFS